MEIDKVAFEWPNTPDRGYTMRVSICADFSHYFLFNLKLFSHLTH